MKQLSFYVVSFLLLTMFTSEIGAHNKIITSVGSASIVKVDSSALSDENVNISVPKFYLSELSPNASKHGIYMRLNVEGALSTTSQYSYFRTDRDASFQQKDNNIIINYSLSRPADISVYLSTDGGKSFGESLQAVTGDVGKDVTAGYKTIVWSPLEEMDTLQGDNIAFQIQVDGVETFTVGDVSFSMIKVEGGTFTMGATEDLFDSQYTPQNLINLKATFQEKNYPHEVTLSDYYVGQTEVTQALWTAVMGTTIEDLHRANKGNKPQLTYSGKGDDWAVYHVSYSDCLAFITKLNQLTGRTFRLLTSAEWEYAARGGHKTNGKIHPSEACSFSTAGVGNATASMVALKKQNDLGVFNILDNLYEWVNDVYENIGTSSPQVNPQGPVSGAKRTFRGYTIYEPGNASVTDKFWNLGFRLALTPETTK